MYTVETDTELYNRLVPWGIATHVRSNGIKRAIRHGQCQRTDGREVELREIGATTAVIDIDLERHNLTNRVSQTISDRQPKQWRTQIDSPLNHGLLMAQPVSYQLQRNDLDGRVTSPLLRPGLYVLITNRYEMNSACMRPRRA